MSGFHLKTKVKLKGEGRAVRKIPELENQFVLRIPEEHGPNLENLVNSGDLKEKLSIDMDADTRHAKVKFNKTVLSAKVMDLPCIVESWKTFDRKSFWKTGDICQMVQCKSKGDDGETSSDEESSRIHDPQKRQLMQTKKFQLPHGLTPPLKNVRRRRFRKTAKKKYIESPEVEREVKRLLRADISAVDVTFEVQSEEKHDDDQSATSDLDVGTNVVPSPAIFLDESTNHASSDNDVDNPLAILPDISSSEDEATIDETNIDDVSLDISNSSLLQGASGDSEQSLDAVSQRRLVQLRDVLRNLQAKKREQEKRVQDASNPFLKQRFQSDLDKISQEEESVTLQIVDLESG